MSTRRKGPFHHEQGSCRIRGMLLHSVLLVLLCHRMHAAPVYEPLASFVAAPQYPSRGALLWIDGEDCFFGTSIRGGGPGLGTVYKISRAGELSVLVQFTGFRDLFPGARPSDGLWHDGNGWLWGTTENGGGSDDGTVFKYNFHSGDFVSVFEFSGNNGADPICKLAPDGQGFLWGTTTRGGTFNEGTIFKLRMNDGAMATMVHLTGTNGPAPGTWPRAGLTSDGMGNLWGVAPLGGAHYNGTVFKVNTTSGAFSNLVEFPVNPFLDGADGQLVYDGSGFLWGTAKGGYIGNDGSVFKVNTVTGAWTLVHQFTAATSGAKPYAGLMDDGNGYLWGTTNGGGSGHGTIFKVHMTTRVFTSVVAFTGTTGAAKGATPSGRLVREGAFLWGTTSAGGAADKGTVFKLNPATGVMTTVYQLTGAPAPGGANGPAGGLARDGVGFFTSAPPLPPRLPA